MQDALHILLVEDEPLIRMTAEDMLTELGHRVRAAGDAAGAARAMKDGAALDLLFADLGLPGAGGHDVAAELLQTHPDLAIVIASGSSGLPPDVDPQVARRAALLSKPYDEAGIARAIAEALSRRRF